MKSVLVLLLHPPSPLIAHFVALLTRRTANQTTTASEAGTLIKSYNQIMRILNLLSLASSKIVKDGLKYLFATALYEDHVISLEKLLSGFPSSFSTMHRTAHARSFLKIAHPAKWRHGSKRYCQILKCRLEKNIKKGHFC